MFTCGTCGREFPAGWRAREQHMNATGHCEPDYECNTCDAYYDCEYDRDLHMNRMGHWVDLSYRLPGPYGEIYECGFCEFCFDDEDDLHVHEASEHYYCAPCSREFRNHNNIEQHLHSKIHRNGVLRCMFCSSGHGTATGLVYHLESGSCPNAPLDRDRLYEAVRSRDPNGIVAKKLLGWTGSTSYEATERAWNPAAGAYQCYFCSRLFGRLNSLNQHLSSPAHQQSLYHCPNRRCRCDFTTLAGTINHLESESCGYMRFEAVQQNVDRILDPGRMIQF